MGGTPNRAKNKKNITSTIAHCCYLFPLCSCFYCQSCKFDTKVALNSQPLHFQAANTGDFCKKGFAVTVENVASPTPENREGASRPEFDDPLEFIERHLTENEAGPQFGGLIAMSKFSMAKLLAGYAATARTQDERPRYPTAAAVVCEQNGRVQAIHMCIDRLIAYRSEFVEALGDTWISGVDSAIDRLKELLQQEIMHQKLPDVAAVADAILAREAKEAGQAQTEVYTRRNTEDIHD